MLIKLLHIPGFDPFRSHIFEVKEFPEHEDLFIFEKIDVDDFIDETLNSRPDSLLGIEVDEGTIDYIESIYLAGVTRLIKPEAQ